MNTGQLVPGSRFRFKRHTTAIQVRGIFRQKSFFAPSAYYKKIYHGNVLGNEIRVPYDLIVQRCYWLENNWLIVCASDDLSGVIVFYQKLSKLPRRPFFIEVEVL